MPSYEAKLKRRGAPVITVEIEGEKFSFDNATSFLTPSRTCSVIKAIIEVMKSEGLDWIRVDEK